MTAMELCRRIVHKLLEKEMILNDMPVVLSNIKLTGDNARPFPDDLLTSVYIMLKFVKENLSQIRKALEQINANGMRCLILWYFHK